MPRQWAHRGTTAHTQAIYPFMYEPRLTSKGVYIGVERETRSTFVYDPFMLYEQKILTNPNAIILGLLGKGKSSLIKTYLYRQANFGRVPFVIDPRGEYTRLAHALGEEVIALKPGGDVKLNPLTRRGGEEEQLELLLTIAAASTSQPLDELQQLACSEVLAELNDRDDDIEPILPDVAEALLNPSQRLQSALGLDAADIIARCRPVGFALRNLVRGPLRGMFDGPTSPGINLDGRIIVLNLAAVQQDRGIGMIMTCAIAWLRAQVQRERDAAADDGTMQIKRIVVVDEAWKVLQNETCGPWLQDAFKNARVYGFQGLIVSHRFSDLSAAGDDGSRTSRLAEGLLSDTETHIIYGQATNEIENTRDLLHLTDRECKILQELRQGQALWRIGGRSFIVVHELSPAPIEHWIVDTDGGMISRPEDGATTIDRPVSVHDGHDPDVEGTPSTLEPVG